MIGGVVEAGRETHCEATHFYTITHKLANIYITDKIFVDFTFGYWVGKASGAGRLVAGVTRA